MDRSTLESLYELFLTHGRITTDSRNCPSGSIFFALKGDKFDGNQYVDQALQNGCAVAVADDPNLKNTDRVFLVDDTLVALQRLAQHHRYQLDIPIIGITGTNGKTTTKELVSSVLAEKYNVFYTQGNLNNHIGVPLTLLSMSNATEIGVVEMGANHIGEIKQLCSICQPNYGLISNIGFAHLEGFGSYEGVKTAKSELYQHIESRNGLLFVNSNDQVLTELSNGIDRLCYGDHSRPNNLVSSENVGVNPYLEFEFRINTGEKFHVSTKLIGKYNIDNAMAAVCIGLFLDVPPVSIVNALEKYTPSNNRSQLTTTEKNNVLMDAYNANPSSMKVAIENFHEIVHPLKVLVLGSMKELGDTSVDEHQKLVNLLQEKGFETVVLVGPEFETVKKPKNYHYFQNTEMAVEFFNQTDIHNAFILIKGSRGNKMETILPSL